MERLTLYTHATDLTYLTTQLAEHGGPLRQTGPLDWQAGSAEAPALRLHGRQRTQPDYQLREITDDFTQNLAGMYGFVQKLPMARTDLQNRLLTKITTLNTELTITAESGFPAGFGAWLAPVLAHYEALVFAEQNSLYPAAGQAFYDPAGRLLTDTRGAGDAAAELPVSIESKYYDELDPLPDQLARKARSEAALQGRGISFAAGLPPVASDTTVALRARDAVVDRALALAYVALKGEGLEADSLEGFDRAYAARNYLSPLEQAFADNPTPDEQARMNATWRYEALHVLLWALGYVSELDYPDHICDPGADIGLLAPLSEAEFRERARLRTTGEILDAADLTYRYAWACVDARLHQRPAPAGLESGVVHERLYALNWLTSRFEEEWDEVSTDT
ncbi:DUF4272 domain-containing protein [Hymenobacter sp. UYP22]|uniref:DUF4272 domain-containing protein n=1 Tax=Hymenobacter sp. UYP22 TaxID=3156348 RepID=UPI003390CBC7